MPSATILKAVAGRFPAALRFALCIALPLAILLAEQYALAGYIGSDFRIFHAAVRRFLADPVTLYAPRGVAIPGAATTLQGYIYPPPGILFLLPFGLPPLPIGFAAFSIGGFVAVIVAMRCWLYALAARDGVLDDRLRVFLLLMALASGPVMACRAGQVDGFVLLASLLAGRLADRHKPTGAGALIALGAWVKLYPLLLIPPLAIRRGSRARLLFGFALGASAVALAGLAVVPIPVWRTWFVDLLPAMSGRTILNIYNQSLLAVYGRAISPHGLATGGYTTIAVPVGVRLAVWIGAGGLLACACWWSSVKRDNLVAQALALATISLMAPLGWGHTYVYTLPLQVLVAARAIERGDVARMLIAAVAWGAMLVSANHNFHIDAAPSLLWQLVYARYALATFALIAAVLWPVQRPSYEREG